MRLLVSVSNASEAAAALSGGADIVDAKDPARGALGAVSVETLAEIERACGGAVPLSAALGDAVSDAQVECDAAAFAGAGAQFVKIGFESPCSVAEMAGLLRAARRGAQVGRPDAAVVAVAYVDATPGSARLLSDVLRAASEAGTQGMLLDTQDKAGPGLRHAMTLADIQAWVDSVHQHGLVAAVAGKLTHDDVGWLLATDVDIVGVRTAACESGRTSAISALRVASLRASCRAASLLGRSSPTRATPAFG